MYPSERNLLHEGKKRRRIQCTRAAAVFIFCFSINSRRKTGGGRGRGFYTPFNHPPAYGTEGTGGAYFTVPGPPGPRVGTAVGEADCVSNITVPPARPHSPDLPKTETARAHPPTEAGPGLQPPGDLT